MKDILHDYLQLINATDITVNDVLNPSNLQEAQKEFLANPELRKPNFKYTGDKNLSAEVLQRNLASIGQITKDLGSDTRLNAAQRQLLELCLEDNKNKNQLALSAIHYRDADCQADQFAAAVDFYNYNIRLYGIDNDIPINHEVYPAMVKWYMDQINPHILEREDDQRMYDSLVEALRNINWQSASLETIYRPSESLMQQYTAIIQQHFGHIFRYIPQQAEYTAQEVCDLINKIIQTEFAGKTKMKAVVDTKRTNMSVNQIERIMYLPTRRAKGPYTYDVVKGVVIGHELCIHIYRSIQYESSGVEPFYQGLPGYSMFEEGQATGAEHSLVKDYRIAGILHYIAIALAEYSSMDFRQIYEVIKALDFLSQTKPNESDTEHQKRLAASQHLAFNNTNRDLRGTGELPYFKDLVYYNANCRFWRYFEQHQDQPDLAIDLFESGKIDPSNPTHYELYLKFKNGEFS